MGLFRKKVLMETRQGRFKKQDRMAVDRPKEERQGSPLGLRNHSVPARCLMVLYSHKVDIFKSIKYRANYC